MGPKNKGKKQIQQNKPRVMWCLYANGKLIVATSDEATALAQATVYRNDEVVKFQEVK